jgi:hypothetical protein
VSGCSSRETFPTESAAKAAVMGKSAHDVIARLGAPDAVTSSQNFDPTSKYTECWKYSRMVRDRSTREMKKLNIYFLKGKVVAVGIDK